MSSEVQTKIFGLKAVLHQMRGGILIELVGSNESRDVLDAMAKEVSDTFDGTSDTPNHPSTSHIRLIRIRCKNNDLAEFVAKLRASGY